MITDSLTVCATQPSTIHTRARKAAKCCAHATFTNVALLQLSPLALYIYIFFLEKWEESPSV